MVDTLRVISVLVLVAAVTTATACRGNDSTAATSAAPPATVATAAPSPTSKLPTATATAALPTTAPGTVFIGERRVYFELLETDAQCNVRAWMPTEESKVEFLAIGYWGVGFDRGEQVNLFVTRDNSVLRGLVLDAPKGRQVLCLYGPVKEEPTKGGWPAGRYRTSFRYNGIELGFNLTDFK